MEGRSGPDGGSQRPGRTEGGPAKSTGPFLDREFDDADRQEVPSWVRFDQGDPAGRSSLAEARIERRDRYPAAHRGFETSGIVSRQIVLSREFDHDAIVMISIECDAHLSRLGECRPSTLRVDTAVPFVDHQRIAQSYHQIPRHDGAVVDRATGRP